MSAPGPEGASPSSPEKDRLPPSLIAVVGTHTTPPARRRYIHRLVISLLGVLLTVILFHNGPWLPAAALLLASASLALPRRDRYRDVVTEVSQTGIRISGRRFRRAYNWADVFEVYPRASWAYYTTMRTAGGSTVVLPGISDETATLLERARADISRLKDVQ